MVILKEIEYVGISVFAFAVCFLITPGLTGYNKNAYDPPSNSSWELPGYALIIDDSDPENNWEHYAQANPQWCAGSGILGNPYVIFNLNIDALQKDTGIKIINSEVHFMLFECDVVNVGDQYDILGLGIHFVNVSNGGIVRCGANSNSWSGISLWDCQNVRISESSISENSVAGIETVNSSAIQIDSNTVNNNAHFGIYLHQSNTSLIEDNDIYNNEDAITLFSGCYQNIITDNTIHNNEVGVYIQLWSHDNVITNNLFSSNTYDVLVGDSCHGTVITNNGECSVYSFDDMPDSPPSEDDTEPIIPGYSVLLLLISMIGIFFVYWFKKRGITKIE